MKYAEKIFGWAILIGVLTTMTVSCNKDNELESAIPKGVIAHWSFENNVNDVVGTFDPTTEGTDVTYVASRNTAAGKAASFNGTTTIIEVPNGDQLMTNGDFAISFWMKADGTKVNHFVLGLGAWYGFQFEIEGQPWTSPTKAVKLATRYQLATLTDTEETLWNGNPNTSPGSEFSKDVSATGGISPIIKDVWVNIVCMYNAGDKVGTMYVNGEKTRQWNFNLWPAGHAKKLATGVVFDGNMFNGGNSLAIGFIQATGNPVVGDAWADPTDPANNHFKGLLDDIRIYNTTFSEAAVLKMYNKEKS